MSHVILARGAQESPYAIATDFATGLNADALRGARLGVARDYFGFHQKAEDVYSEVLEALRMAGAILVDPVKIPTSERLKDAKRIVLLYEMKAGLNAYFEMQGLQCPVKTVQDVIEFNKVNSSAVMQWFGQELLQMASAKGHLNEDHYLSAVEVCNREGLTEGIEETMHAKQLDAFIAPTDGPAWKTDMVLGDHFLGGSTSPAAISGTPSITVPAGMVNGLPLGFSFFSAKWSEIKLLNLAFSFESCLKARRRPGYFPRID